MSYRYLVIHCGTDQTLREGTIRATATKRKDGSEHHTFNRKTTGRILTKVAHDHNISITDLEMRFYEM